jgi:hypothetical protein
MFSFVLTRISEFSCIDKKTFTVAKVLINVLWVLFQTNFNNNDFLLIYLHIYYIITFKINLQLLFLNWTQIQAETVRWRLVFDLVRAGGIRTSGQHEGRRQRRGSKCSRSSQLLDAKVSTAGNVWVFFFFYRQLQNDLNTYSFKSTEISYWIVFLKIRKVSQFVWEINICNFLIYNCFPKGLQEPDWNDEGAARCCCRLRARPKAKSLRTGDWDRLLSSQSTNSLRWKLTRFLFVIYS